MKMKTVGGLYELGKVLENLDTEIIINYEGSGQHWNDYHKYLMSNYKNDFYFEYIGKEDPLRNISKTIYSFYIGPKKVTSETEGPEIKISPVLFDIKNLNI